MKKLPVLVFLEKILLGLIVITFTLLYLNQDRSGNLYMYTNASFAFLLVFGLLSKVLMNETSIRVLDSDLLKRKEYIIDNGYIDDCLELAVTSYITISRSLGADNDEIIEGVSRMIKHLDKKGMEIC